MNPASWLLLAAALAWLLWTMIRVPGESLTEDERLARVVSGLEQMLRELARP